MPMVLPGIDESIFKKLSKRLQKQLKATHPQLQLATLQEAMAKALGHASLHDARQHWSRSAGVTVETPVTHAQGSEKTPPVSPRGELLPPADNAWLSQGRQTFKEWALKTDSVAWRAAKALERGEPLVEILGEDERFWRGENGELLLQRMATHGWWNGVLEVWQGLPGLHVSASLLPQVAFWAHQCDPASSVDWEGLLGRVWPSASDKVVVKELRGHFTRLPLRLPQIKGLRTPWEAYPAALLEAVVASQRGSQSRSWWAVVALEEDPAPLLEEAPAKELWDMRNELAGRGLWKALDGLVQDLPLGLKDWVGLCAAAGAKSGRVDPEAVEYLQAWLLNRVTASPARWNLERIGVAAEQGQPPGFWKMNLQHLPDGLGARVWQTLVQVGGGWEPGSISFTMANKEALLVACQKLMGEEKKVLEDFLKGVHQDTSQDAWHRFLTHVMTDVAWESHGEGLCSTEPEDMACGRLLDRLASMGGSWTETDEKSISQEKHSPQSVLYRGWGDFWPLENRVWPGNDINAACVGFNGHLFSVPQMALLSGCLSRAEQIEKQKQSGIRFELKDTQKEVALNAYLQGCSGWFEDDEDGEGEPRMVFSAEKGMRLTEQWLRESGVWGNKEVMQKAYGFVLYPELLYQWRHWCGALPTSADVAIWFEQAGFGPGWGRALAQSELEGVVGACALRPGKPHVERIRSLIRQAVEWKVNMVTPRWDATTVLHHAAALKTTTEKQEMVVLDILEELLAAGANPRAQDFEGKSPRDWVPEKASVRRAFLSEAMQQQQRARSGLSL